MLAYTVTGQRREKSMTLQCAMSNFGSIGVAELFSAAGRFEPPTSKNRSEQIFACTVTGRRREKSMTLQRTRSNVDSIGVAGLFSEAGRFEAPTREKEIGTALHLYGCRYKK